MREGQSLKWNLSSLLIRLNFNVVKRQIRTIFVDKFSTDIHESERVDNTLNDTFLFGDFSRESFSYRRLTIDDEEKDSLEKATKCMTKLQN